MAIKFTARHMSGGTKHEHIAALRWIQDGQTETQECTRELLVDWIKNKGGAGYVLDSQGDNAWVKVVETNPPYLRTKKDGVWKDNLLALPSY